MLIYNIYKKYNHLLYIMGNTSSSDKKSLEHIVNYLAAQYITKDEFKNMINLKDQEYCDKLIILTSKIFKEYLNPSMIEYLSVKKGIEGDIYSENIIRDPEVIIKFFKNSKVSENRSIKNSFDMMNWEIILQKN